MRGARFFFHAQDRMEYRVEEKGFYFKPADPRSNNEVIFVPVSALKEVKLGDVEAAST